MMVVDDQGYRLNVGIILVDDQGNVFWGRRLGHDAWQFPQGGLNPEESAEQAMYRELEEEVGLEPDDVEILACTSTWLPYRLPEHFIRHNSKPLVIGQKQKWFLLQLISAEKNIRFDMTNSPEFTDWLWVDISHPLTEVIDFKQRVYKLALEEFEPMIEQLAIRR